jgi:hypothetical protein
MKQILSMVLDSFLEKLNEKQDQIIDLLKSTVHIVKIASITLSESKQNQYINMMIGPIMWQIDIR